MKLSIVIPAYNEERVLPSLLQQIDAALTLVNVDETEIVIVDDGSVDDTWKLLQELASETKRQTVKAIRFSRNFGKEAAILAGLRCAGGDAVIVMDADLQHSPSLIPEMITIWSEGRYYIVEVIKKQRQREPTWRRIAARSFYRIVLAGSEIDLRNSTDFKLLDRRVVDQYVELPETGRFFRGLTSWLGFPTATLEVSVPHRRAGKSAWGLAKLLELARHTIVSFTALPLRLISWIGFFGVGFSLILAIQTLWNKLFGSSEAGFPTTIIVVLFMGSMILVGLGILGEYLSEIYREVKRRPPYLIRDTTLRRNHSSEESKLRS